jgi:predicted amidophosphoribosyltransferase
MYKNEKNMIKMNSYVGNARNIAKMVKNDNNPTLYYQIAKYMAKQVHYDDILVPAPNHCGRAVYTLEIAKMITEMTGARIEDCITVKPHNCLYTPNIERAFADKYDKLSMNLNENVDLTHNGRILLIDNVIDTGATYLAAKKLIPELIPICYCSTGRFR